MPCHFLVHDGNYTGQSRRDSTRLVVSLSLIAGGDDDFYALTNAPGCSRAPEIPTFSGFSCFRFTTTNRYGEVTIQNLLLPDAATLQRFIPYRGTSTAENGSG